MAPATAESRGSQHPRREFRRRHALLAATAASALMLGFAAQVAAQAPQAAAPNPVQLVDALEGTFGKRDGFRRSHAKGLCATGSFVGTPEGRALSSAAMFKGQSIPATPRFLLGGGNPGLSDKSRSARGLGVALDLPQGQAAARTRGLAAAEDALAKAFRAALETWPERGVPDNPEAWLLTTARRTLGHAARHLGVRQAALPALAQLADEAEARAPKRPFRTNGSRCCSSAPTPPSPRPTARR